MNDLVSRRRAPNVDRTEQRRIVSAALRALKPGEMITYAELGRLIGMRDARQCWHVLNVSRNDLLMRSGIEFEAVINIGLRRTGRPEEFATTVEP